MYTPEAKFFIKHPRAVEKEVGSTGLVTVTQAAITVFSFAGGRGEQEQNALLSAGTILGVKELGATREDISRALSLGEIIGREIANNPESKPTYRYAREPQLEQE